MVTWHVLAILAVRELSSGRTAILGYKMPVFAALWGSAVFNDRISRRASAGVAAAALGVALLLWHEMSALAGRPLGVVMMLCAAVAWGFGTHQLRRTRIVAPTLAISFWMTGLAAVVTAACATAFERDAWHTPPNAVWAAVGYTLS